MSNDRIKYYGKNDLGTYHYLSRLYSFLDNTDFKQPISDINTAIAVSYTHLDVYKRQASRAYTSANSIPLLILLWFVMTIL